MSITETVERLEREGRETVESVSAYVEKVKAKDAEQEAAIEAQAEEIRNLRDQLANAGTPQDLIDRVDAVASALDGIQSAIAEPVPAPELPAVEG